MFCIRQTYLLNYLLYLLTYSLTHSHTHLLTLLTYFLTNLLTYSLTHSHTHLLTLLTYFLTNLLAHLLTHSLITYLLTYSLEQSPSWETNRFSTSQEIPHILWNPNVRYRIQKCLPPISILSQLDPAHIHTVFVIHQWQKCGFNMPVYRLHRVQEIHVIWLAGTLQFYNVSGVSSLIAERFVSFLHSRMPPRCSSEKVWSCAVVGHCTLLGKIFFESNLIWSCLFSGLTNETRLPCRYLAAAAVSTIVGRSTLADSGLHFLWNIDHSLVIWVMIGYRKRLLYCDWWREKTFSYVWTGSNFAVILTRQFEDQLSLSK